MTGRPARLLAAALIAGSLVLAACGSEDEGLPVLTDGDELRWEAPDRTACGAELDTLSTAIEAHKALEGEAPRSMADLTGAGGLLSAAPTWWTLDADGTIVGIGANEDGSCDGALIDGASQDGTS